MVKLPPVLLNLWSKINIVAVSCLKWLYPVYWGKFNQPFYCVNSINPIQWTIANLVGADRPAKRLKKLSCVSTSRAGLVLCIRQVAHRTSFLSRQSDVIASFSFGACIV